MKTATIIIRDEVNIKIEGLELDARRALVNAFKYDVPGARYLPAVRLGRWDGKVSYFQLGGSTYVNLLPEIVPILEKFNYDIELDDQRTYSTTFDFDHIKEDSFAHKVWPKTHPMAGQPVVLRDYQVEIINAFLGNPQCIQEVATGRWQNIDDSGIEFEHRTVWSQYCYCAQQEFGHTNRSRLHQFGTRCGCVLW
jgi:hypothetical protein